MSDLEMEEKGRKGGKLEDSGSMPEVSVAYALSKFKSAARSSLTNRYMLANIVYLGYAIGILFIDFGTENYDTKEINRLFQGFNIVHLVSAFLYVWAWRGFPWLHIIMIPELFNIVEAILYITSSFYYDKQDTESDNPYLDDYTLLTHDLETAACVISCAASFGWVATWWITYLRTPGRGWTIDDPDVIAWNCTLTASLVYVVYNAKIQEDHASYATEYMYRNADIVYFIGAVFYVFAAMRDDGWWWFMPFAGECGAQVPVKAGDMDEEPSRKTVRGFLYHCGLPLWPKSWTLGGWYPRLC